MADGPQGDCGEGWSQNGVLPLHTVSLGASGALTEGQSGSAGLAGWAEGAGGGVGRAGGWERARVWERTVRPPHHAVFRF